MFCPKCGREIPDGSYTCNGCGANVGDKGGFKYGFLGFLFPIAGVIIYYMLKDEEPNLSESFKIGSIVGLIMLYLLLIANILFSFMRPYIESTEIFF